jgi:hypothetical protein
VSARSSSARRRAIRCWISPLAALSRTARSISRWQTWLISPRDTLVGRPATATQVNMTSWKPTALSKQEGRAVAPRSVNCFAARQPRRLTRRPHSCCVVRTRSSQGRTRSHPQHSNTTRTPTTNPEPITLNTRRRVTRRRRSSRSKLG